MAIIINYCYNHQPSKQWCLRWCTRAYYYSISYIHVPYAYSVAAVPMQLENTRMGLSHTRILTHAVASCCCPAARVYSHGTVPYEYTLAARQQQLHYTHMGLSHAYAYMHMGLSHMRICMLLSNSPMHIRAWTVPCICSSVSCSPILVSLIHMHGIIEQWQQQQHPEQ